MSGPNLARMASSTFRIRVRAPGLWHHRIPCSAPTGRQRGSRRPNLYPNAAPQISAFDPATGKKQWAFKTNHITTSLPVVDGGRSGFRRSEGNRVLLWTQVKQERSCGRFNTGGRIVAALVSFLRRGRQFQTISTFMAAPILRVISRVIPGKQRTSAATFGHALFVLLYSEKSK